jgi:hypothetical protein
MLLSSYAAAVADLTEDNRVDMPTGVRSIYDRLVRVKEGLQELKRAGGKPSLDMLHKLQVKPSQGIIGDNRGRVHRDHQGAHLPYYPQLPFSSILQGVDTFLHFVESICPQFVQF